MFQCSKYEISSTPKGGLTATKQKLPSLPSDYAESTISSPDKDIVEPIYEDVDSSVQQPKDVADTDVKIKRMKLTMHISLLRQINVHKHM